LKTFALSELPTSGTWYLHPNR